MRKLLTIMCLLGVFLHQQSAFAEYDISFYQNDNRCTYYAHFELPNFTIADTSLYALDSNGDATNTVLYSTISGLDSMTWLCLKSGTPSLPCYTITLPITKDASNFELTRILERGDSIKSLVLSRQLYPEGYPDVQPNNDYYNCDENIVIQPFVVDTFTTYGLDGVTIAICPFAYIPKSNKLYYQPVIDFQFSFATSTEQFGTNEEVDAEAYEHIKSLFDCFPNNSGAKGQTEEMDVLINLFSVLASFNSDIETLAGHYSDCVSCIEEYRSSKNTEHPENKDIKILVVCHKSYVKKMKDYTMYKRYQGYTVGLVQVDSIKKDQLHTYLRGLYANRIAPKYVLLVGNEKEIECYGDKTGVDPHDPPTDFPFCYSGDYAGHTDYHIGRFFPSDSVDNIIYQTMCSEQNYKNLERHVLKVTGVSLGNYSLGLGMSGTAKIEGLDVSDWVKGLVQGLKGHTIASVTIDEMYFGRWALKSVEFQGVAEHHCNRQGKATFINYINKQPYWLLLYNGHGYIEYNYPAEGFVARDTNWYNEQVEPTKTIFPIMFFQACRNGSYQRDGFGVKSQNNVCSAFIGASTNTGARWGQMMINKAFDNGDKTSWKKKERLGDFLDHAKMYAFESKKINTKYFLSNKHESVKRFNLFGDPSLLYRGMSFENLTFETENWYSILYYRAKTISTGDNTKVTCKPKSDVKLVASEKISLKPGFKVEKGATFKTEIVKKYKYEE